MTPRNRVLRDGKHDIIFATEAEALRAANAAFLSYLNSPITGISSMGGSKKSGLRLCPGCTGKHERNHGTIGHLLCWAVSNGGDNNGY
jgi:hypothetical protein